MSDDVVADQSFGVLENSKRIQGAWLKWQRGLPSLLALKSWPLIKGEEKATRQMAEEVDFSSFGQESLIVTSLRGDEVLVRPLEVALKRASDIDAVLTFQAEPLLPYPIEEAQLDWIPFLSLPEANHLTLTVARKETVQKHIEEWQQWQIDPEVVSCHPIALANFASFFFPNQGMQLLLHLDPEFILLLLLKGGRLQASIHLSFDLLPLFEGIESEEGGEEKFSMLAQERWEKIRVEILRATYALSKLGKGESISEVILTGEVVSSPHLVASICSAIDKPLALLSPREGFAPPTKELLEAAIPIGSALSCLPKTTQQVNFRQQELAYPYPWRRYKKSILLYFLLCLALASTLHLAAFTYLAYQENQIRREYATLLEGMHRPYSSLERAFYAKISGKKEQEGIEITPLALLTQKELHARLNFLEEELTHSAYYYPLLPNIATVSDLLAWLVDHPKVVLKDSTTGQKSPLLEIESLSYQMIKRPDQTKKLEKYQVKVELEFSSPTPKAAREFHDALLAPNPMVDPKGEVKWNTNRGLYRASFFLKDRTVYPTPS